MWLLATRAQMGCWRNTQLTQLLSQGRMTMSKTRQMALKMLI